MTVLLSPNAKQQFFTSAGAPAAGFKLFTYAAGTTTPQVTYSNRAGTAANANPIVLNARGEAAVYVTPGLVYDYVLKSGADVEEWTQAGVSAQAGEASSVHFTQAGTGAVARTVAANNELLLNVMDFVAVADDAATLAGTLDCSAAVGKAIDAAIARGRGGITFPAGRFLIGAKVAKTLTTTTGFSIEGAGMGVTQLIMADPNGDGLHLTAAAGDGNWWLNVDPSSAIRIAHLSILAVANNLGTGLKIDGNSLEGRPPAPATLDHVEIRAKDGINTQAFLTGLWLHDVGSVAMSKCRFLVGGTTNLTPTAVKISATDATTDPTLFYFDHCEWTYGGKGIVAGDHAEGIYLTNCTMVKVDVGVEWTAPVSGESGLHVVGGHFNCLTRNFDLNGIYDFAITGAVCFLSGGTPLDHIRLDNNGSFAITGNVFRAGAKGVDVGTIAGTARGGYIGANQFEGMTTAAIALAADAGNVTVGLNGYTNVAARVTGAGGSNAFIQKRSYSANSTVTLVGGAASENVNAPIPSGVFAGKPTVAMVVAEASSQDYILTPAQTSASTTATNLVVRVVKRDGTALTAGAVLRYHMAVYE